MTVSDPLAATYQACQCSLMLSREDMFPLLIQADPSFAPAWQAFLSEWDGEPDPPYYIALGDLAHHLVEKQRGSEKQILRAVFDIVERWHVEGDEFVGEAATIGLLEGLQNILGGNKRNKSIGGVRASDFEAYLGPETQRWWDKLYRFWDGEVEALRYDN